MGQKVNPEIFKLSRTAGWKSKYFEGKKLDLGLYTRKDFWVKTFTKHFFTKMGLNVHSCKVAHLNNKLIIQSNYIQSLDVTDGMQMFNSTGKKKNLIQYKIAVNVRFKIKALTFIALLYHKNLATKQFCEIHANGRECEKYLYGKQNKSDLNYQDFIHQSFFFQKAQNYLGLKPEMQSSSKFSSVQVSPKSGINYYPITNDIIKTIVQISLYFIRINQKALFRKTSYDSYSFMNLFFKSFSLYYDKSLKITLIFKSLQKNIIKTSLSSKKALLFKGLLYTRRYKRNTFFHRGINLMFLMTSQKEAADSLASFIAHSLRNFKKHKLFLKFIQKGLSAFSKVRTVIKAVKIQLKGRINGADRARSYTIGVGNQLSLLTTSSRINYSEKTTFTPDGTLSVKVWIRYSKILKQFKSPPKSLIKRHESIPPKNEVQKNKKRQTIKI